MPYPRTANGVSRRSLYLGETRESADERMQQKRENGVMDRVWILLSAVRVMMMRRGPERLAKGEGSRANEGAHIFLNPFLCIRCTNTTPC